MTSFGGKDLEIHTDPLVTNIDSPQVAEILCVMLALYSTKLKEFALNLEHTTSKSCKTHRNDLEL